MIILWILIPVLTTINQSLIKITAIKLTKTQFGLLWLKQALLLPYTYGIITCEILGLIIWMKILSNNSISKAFPISSISYIFITLASWFVFNEPIKFLQITGMAFILSGVYLISMADSR